MMSMQPRVASLSLRGPHDRQRAKLGGAVFETLKRNCEFKHYALRPPRCSSSAGTIVVSELKTNVYGTAVTSQRVRVVLKT